MWYWERTSTPRYRRRHRNPLVTLLILGIIFGVFINAAQWWLPVVLLFIIIPMFASRRDDRRGEHDDDDEYEKPKHDFEKPKHEPHYALGNDGELIEVERDEDDDDPPSVYDDDHPLYL